MKKLLITSILGVVSLSLTSCDFKDKNGNAPLIENEEGLLVDNPDYKTEEQYQYEEKMEPIRAEYNATRKDDGTSITLDGESTIQDRENFSKTFKPKTGNTKIVLSGKNKTTINLISGFITEFTVEQYENLNYFSTLKELGFKKVIFNNGRNNITTIDL